MKPEDELQIQVATFIRYQYPRLMWWHVPNGGKRTKAEAGIFNAMGVRAGVPDLCFLLHGGRAAFIELKAGKNSQTTSQKDFEKEATENGAAYHVARSLEDVQDILALWRLDGLL